MGADKKSKKRGPKRAPLASGPAVWDIPAWCGQLGIGRSTFYTLAPKPQTVYVGKLCKIIEAPGDYARRIAALQQSSGNRGAAA